MRELISLAAAAFIARQIRLQCPIKGYDRLREQISNILFLQHHFLCHFNGIFSKQHLGG